MAWTPEEQRAYSRAYYQKNREKLVERARKWRAANPEKVREIQRRSDEKRDRHQYYLDNKDSIDARTKRWRQANKERVRANQKRWKAENPDRVKANHQRRKAKHVLETRAWRKANPDKVRSSVLRKKYGISLADYEMRVKAQAGLCAICGKSAKLVVDHCHASSRIRGLLCSPCNRALGYFYDSPKILRAAADYLETK